MLKGQAGLSALVKIFTYGILGVAAVALIASLISGLAGKTDLINTFMPVVYLSIGVFAVIALIKALK